MYILSCISNWLINFVLLNMILNIIWDSSVGIVYGRIKIVFYSFLKIIDLVFNISVWKNLLKKIVIVEKIV